MENKMSKTDSTLIKDVLQILQTAREKTYAHVNKEMVQTYWLMGKRIVEEEQQGEQKATYGEAILKTLSAALTAQLGKGFSYANLRNFRQFYITYPDPENCYALRSNLSWTHHRLIMRVENHEARDYYIKECEEQMWSTRTLERNINTFYFQRLLSSQNKQEALQNSNTLEKTNPNDFIKDPYVFEFLNIPEPIQVTEKEIESALIENLQHFLLELGKGFSFVGRQFRISTETSHFYIDLVFYNYILKCFVLFDLKTTKLLHQDTGQMDMYIRMFDDLKKQDNDNATIGIILCAEKDETVVKYSILNDNKQLFATKYMPYLPTEAELIAEIERERRLIEEQLSKDKDKDNG
jgi:predicted nuclease of restriction endonuclease-like (RecB) superfamily